MQLTVRVLASTVTIDLDESLPVAVRERIVDQWSHLRVTSPTRDAAVLRLRMHDATPNSDPTLQDVSVSDADSAPDTLASHLTLHGLNELAGRAFLLHAAGLATADGSVIALVGPSGRGKTTASRELGQRLGYVTDETVAFDPDGAVTPYPKPLSIGHRPTPKVLYPPSELGLTVAEQPLRIAALVLLDREPARTDVVVESVPLIEALAELAPQSSSLWKIPSALRRLVEVIDRTGGVRRVRYGDAEQLPAAVPGILAARTPVRERVEPLQLVDVPPDREGIARAPFADAMAVDDAVVVVGSQGLHALDGIGPAIWLAADGVEPDTIHEHVIQLIGDPPDGIDTGVAVMAGIERLREERLLRRD